MRFRRHEPVCAHPRTRFLWGCHVSEQARTLRRSRDDRLPSARLGALAEGLRPGCAAFGPIDRGQRPGQQLPAHHAEPEGERAGAESRDRAGRQILTAEHEPGHRTELRQHPGLDATRPETPRPSDREHIDRRRTAHDSGHRVLPRRVRLAEISDRKRADAARPSQRESPDDRFDRRELRVGQPPDLIQDAIGDRTLDARDKPAAGDEEPARRSGGRSVPCETGRHRVGPPGDRVGATPRCTT
ncbi:conserved hypothetical protein [Leifsonia xyli subsp. xyli str. CTCB07]|uniref:Uncharacterized protein n=1 Tax=Leifsonia xyli subsp. xyli (strain CTCB07) TaxID=281090 RepID=Q6AEZ8_LEIXX|nr:conserved hypothetical protein [Leifsonia xyli subsp. xyli str. CTCB07]